MTKHNHQVVFGLTREDITNRYKISSKGIIINHGKFECEMLYVPYFWEKGLSFGADFDDGTTMSFAVTPEDRRKFPELGQENWIKLQRCDEGFVYEV